MEYKIFESSDTNVKKFVFEWGASGVTKKGIAEAYYIVTTVMLNEQ